MVRRFQIYLNKTPKTFSVVIGSEDDVQKMPIALSSSVAVRNLTAEASYEQDLYTDDNEALYTDDEEAIIADASISTK